MFINARLQTALNTHEWPEPVATTQTCRVCGYEMPTGARGPGYRVVRMPHCPGAQDVDADAPAPEPAQ